MEKTITSIVNIDQELCTGCGDCVEMCPREILYINAETDKCAVSNQYQCDRLGGCERKCPTSAIRINEPV